MQPYIYITNPPIHSHARFPSVNIHKYEYQISIKYFLIRNAHTYNSGIDEGHWVVAWQPLFRIYRLLETTMM